MGYSRRTLNPSTLNPKPPKLQLLSPKAMEESGGLVLLAEFPKFEGPPYKCVFRVRGVGVKVYGFTV